jgi:EmrB/QacA subfamily drug resistance transporter
MSNVAHERLARDGQSLVLPEDTDPNAAVPRHLGLALVVISLAQLMFVLDELIVNTALPDVQRALHFSGADLEWIVTAYAITFGGLLLLGGRAGDIYGRRQMFIVGVVLFSVASGLGGFATKEWWLLTARAVQGVGAALAAPAALSLIAVTFPEGKQRNRALGVYAAMTGMGGAAGLISGGLLTTYASWRWVFFVNVFVGLPVAIGALYAIPQTLRFPRRFDLPGAITGSAAFALVVYGLSQGATGPDGVSHWGDLSAIVPLTGAVAALIAFIVIEAHTREPLLPLKILADRNRAGVLVILICLASAFFGMFFFVTVFMQNVLGYSALKAGLGYLPFMVGFLIVSGICTKLVTRIGVRIPLSIGTPLAAGGMFWLSRISVDSDYVSGLLVPFVVFAFGAGLVFVPMTMTLVAGISDKDQGVASSLFNSGQQIGGALGLAAIGSVTWSVFNNHVRDSAAHVAGASSAVPRPGSALYDHALAAGIKSGLTVGAGGVALAFVVALVAIRIRREALPEGMVII